MVLIIRRKILWLFLLFPVIMGVVLLAMPHIKSADDWQTVLSRIEKSDPIEKVYVTLPGVFDPVFLHYNELQTESGFDLSPYAGEKLLRKTYCYPEGQTAWRLNLLYDGSTLVGGDWADIRLGGEMLPLSQLQRSIP